MSFSNQECQGVGFEHIRATLYQLRIPKSTLHCYVLEAEIKVPHNVISRPQEMNLRWQKVLCETKWNVSCHKKVSLRAQGNAGWWVPPATGPGWEGHPVLSTPRPLPERASEVAGVSSFMKAASIAWLKEFWKLGTGTRSELSLSPSLSTVAGGTKLFSSKKQPVLQF